MKYRIKEICILLIALVIAFTAIYLTGQHQRLTYSDQMIDAARRMEAAEQVIKEERLARGIELSDEDILQIGLLGCEKSNITTTLGAVEAKRTSAIPDMAALCVRLFHEAGLQEGDTVGACFSGSFPGLDLAVLCAADAMNLNVIYTVSIGTSSYGGNHPEFTTPEMLLCAYESGYISTAPSEISIGGQDDAGHNMIGYVLEDMDDINNMLQRLADAGITVESHEDFQENVSYHENLYGSIDCFVNAGGSAAGTGEGEDIPELGQGLLKKQNITLTENSGLLEYYLSEQVPTINLLNVKQLCAEYQITFDPDTLPEDGTSGVYFASIYNVPAIVITLICAVAFLIYIARKKAPAKK